MWLWSKETIRENIKSVDHNRLLGLRLELASQPQVFWEVVVYTAYDRVFVKGQFCNINQRPMDCCMSNVCTHIVFVTAQMKLHLWHGQKNASPNDAFLSIRLIELVAS